MVYRVKAIFFVFVSLFVLFSISHVWMLELDLKEGWKPKNLCLWTVVLEKTLESFLDYKENKPVITIGNQLRVFFGRTEAEALILWPPDVKSRFTEKNPDGGKNWGQEEKGTTEDEMIGWHHWVNGHEFEQALGDGEGQVSQECCNPWNCKESDTTEWLNNNNKNIIK